MFRLGWQLESSMMQLREASKNLNLECRRVVVAKIFRIPIVIIVKKNFKKFSTVNVSREKSFYTGPCTNIYKHVDSLVSNRNLFSIPWFILKQIPFVSILIVKTSVYIPFNIPSSH